MEDNHDKMIPKDIHYCWFGRGEKPELLNDCIKSWREKCPDYEIIEWNEDNFDINYCQYTIDAYKEKKYAFVSDVARLWIIYHYGGHYLDTDVMLRTSLDALSNYKAWFASDTSIYVSTGLGFGSIKGNLLIKKMLDDYNDRPFSLDTCPSINTKVIKSVYPDIFFSKTQVIDDMLFLGMTDYGKYARHLYTATWIDDSKVLSPSKNEKPKKSEKMKWRISVWLQSNRIMQWSVKHKGNFFSKIYIFYVFDIFIPGSLSPVFRILKNKIKKSQ